MGADRPLKRKTYSNHACASLGSKFSVLATRGRWWYDSEHSSRPTLCSDARIGPRALNISFIDRKLKWISKDMLLCGYGQRIAVQEISRTFVRAPCWWGLFYACVTWLDRTFGFLDRQKCVLSMHVLIYCCVSGIGHAKSDLQQLFIDAGTQLSNPSHSSRMVRYGMEMIWITPGAAIKRFVGHAGGAVGQGTLPSLITF